MSEATTTWISGPVLRARPDGPFRLREAVTVGGCLLYTSDAADERG